MKRLFILQIISFTITLPLSAQEPTSIVKEFGSVMKAWCKSDDVTYRNKAKALATGEIKCLVDDKITQDAVRNDPNQLLTNGTQEIDTYLNIMDRAITEGQDYDMGNVQSHSDFIAPTAFKNEVPPNFVSASILLRGQLAYDITDMFFVRDGKITKIVDYSSDESLGKALELYSNHSYDEAFRIFRKLAYADYTNFDAQYYMVVMELKGQGCGHISKKFRNQELSWFIVQNFYANNKEAIKLSMKFPVDDTKLSYSYHSHYRDWMYWCKQPANSDRMMSYDAKSNSCGFIDSNGKLVIPYKKYKFAFPFHDGLSLVFSKVTGYCGFIDKNGTEQVPVIYQNAICDFYNGRTWCTKDGNAYLIDKQGKVMKIVEGHPYVSSFMPAGKYAALYKNESTYDIYDYDGNLCYKDYTSWSYNSSNGLVTMTNGSGSDNVQYKATW